MSIDLITGKVIVPENLVTLSMGNTTFAFDVESFTGGAFSKALSGLNTPSTRDDFVNHLTTYADNRMSSIVVVRTRKPLGTQSRYKHILFQIDTPIRELLLKVLNLHSSNPEKNADYDVRVDGRSMYSLLQDTYTEYIQFITVITVVYSAEGRDERIKLLPEYFQRHWCVIDGVVTLGVTSNLTQDLIEANSDVWEWLAYPVEKFEELRPANLDTLIVKNRELLPQLPVLVRDLKWRIICGEVTLCASENHCLGNTSPGSLSDFQMWIKTHNGGKTICLPSFFSLGGKLNEYVKCGYKLPTLPITPSSLPFVRDMNWYFMSPTLVELTHRDVNGIMLISSIIEKFWMWVDEYNKKTIEERKAFGLMYNLDTKLGFMVAEAVKQGLTLPPRYR